MPYGNSSAAGDVGVARTGSLADHVDLLEAGVTMKSFELVVGWNRLWRSTPEARVIVGTVTRAAIWAPRRR